MAALVDCPGRTRRTSFNLQVMSFSEQYKMLSKRHDLAQSGVGKCYPFVPCHKLEVVEHILQHAGGAFSSCLCLVRLSLDAGRED